MEKLSVYVGMPSGSWLPRSEVILAVFNQEVVRNGEIELRFFDEGIIKRKPIQFARNEILNNFLKSGCDYLWFVDDDNPPNPDVLGKLIRAKKDAVSALVPIRHGDKYLLNVFTGEGTHLVDYSGYEEEVIEISNCGTGCVLLSRQLVSSMWSEFDGNPYQFRIEEFVCKKDGNVEKYEYQDKYSDCEDYVKDKDGKLLIRKESISEDLFFGREARKLGFRFFAVLSAHCTHYKGETVLKVKVDKTFGKEIAFDTGSDSQPNELRGDSVYQTPEGEFDGELGEDFVTLYGMGSSYVRR